MEEKDPDYESIFNRAST
jgi:ATP-binding cassette subfamily B protein